MDHDDMCHRQEQQVAVLTERLTTIGRDLDTVVERVQELVDQFHAQNVSQTRIEGKLTTIERKIDAIEVSLGRDFALRAEFVEVKTEWRRFLGLVLASVLAAILGGIGWISKGSFK